MSDFHDAAKRLIDALSLERAPIAVSFVDAAPAGVEPFDARLAAGCGFWELAATRAFSTTASDHELCAIGVHTHNLAGASASTAGELGKVLEVMADLDYARPDEVAAIPVMSRSAAVVVYAPLASAPLPPDAVVLFARADQSLVISEAVARVDGGVAPAMGRPACAMIPQAINSARAVMSLGCCGARAYLDALSPQTALWTLPGPRASEYAAEIATLAGANRTLAAFHVQRRADVASGMAPSIGESLERMSSE